jgi:transketolase
VRDAFVKTLTEIARVDRNVMLLTGDLGFGVLTKFAENFPEQFLNVGVAEQNMTGLAAGLALEGKTVFTYSICNFPTLRCLEQIRNDICYHNANVKIVSIGGGFCYGPLGMSHHATEDLAIMRAIPNLTVVAPGDTVETMLATRAICDHKGPCFLRLGRGGEPKVYDKIPEFVLGKAINVTSGGDVSILSIGGIMSNVMKAREILKKRGIDVSVYSLHTLRPIDRELIESLANGSRLVVTVEEHSIAGGLGGAVAEILAEIRGKRAPLLRIGTDGNFCCEVGDQQYLRGLYGLDPESIADGVEKAIL